MRSIRIPSGERVWVIFSRSSTAIRWVSRSESFEREVRIRCFISTIARWDDTENDDDDDEDLDGGGWFDGFCGGGFVGFVELILWELIFVFVREMQMGGAEFLERESEERERGGVRSKNVV